jgi:aldose sugar dehydrogenase
MKQKYSRVANILQLMINLLIASFFLFTFSMFIMNMEFENVFSEPYMLDNNLKIEKVYSGLNFPVSMSFIDDDDFIVLEKNNGTVHRIVNGQLIPEPLLKVNVDTQMERGLLGSAVGYDPMGNRNIFLYYTEGSKTVNYKGNSSDNQTGENKLYKYELINGKLKNPKLIFKSPVFDDPYHHGGKIVIGPDNDLYLLIGDSSHINKAQVLNYDENLVDGYGGIMRMDLDGMPVEGILADYFPLNLYYAYGIRNGFGMDFDPITGYLWDTENGPAEGDEINLVEPGFNSGWARVQGIWQPGDEDFLKLFTDGSELYDFDGKGKYSPPEYIWKTPVGVTALKFLNSSALGKQYENDMFVGDILQGNLYHFDLNKNRTKLIDDYAQIDRLHYPFNNKSTLIFDDAGFHQCIKWFICEVASKNDSNISSNILSTSTKIKEKWSNIQGLEYNVSSLDSYNFTTTIKLNEFVNQTHIYIEGYNSVKDVWEPITYCPNGVDGPINWTKFNCTIDVPLNISKIRPVINGGYSNTDEKEGVSYFKDIIMLYNDKVINLFPKFNMSSYPILGKGFGAITDIQVGPDGNLYILTIGAEDEDAVKPWKSDKNSGIVYRIVKND